MLEQKKKNHKSLKTKIEKKKNSYRNNPETQ